MGKTDESGLFAGAHGNRMILERAASLKDFLYNRPEWEIIILSGNDFNAVKLEISSPLFR